jgi:hypothetical protein
MRRSSSTRLRVQDMNMREIALAVNAHAPRLDEVEKVKFSMYLHNQYAYETDLSGLNLANEWRNYREDK